MVAAAGAVAVAQHTEERVYMLESFFLFCAYIW